MEPTFGYIFPAIRGIQAGREYYVSMCPLRLLNKIFSYDEEEIRPEMRAQRTLNRARIPEISHYITENAGDYVFSAITASIDGEFKFDAVGTSKEARKLGSLHVSMDSRFLINDGQHRRAAIKHALEEHPELGDETIAVVFFIDRGLQRSQQMFADLNRHAVRPAKSLGVLFDHRDDLAQVVRRAVLESEFFRDIVEMERSSLSKGSRKLLTLSAIYNGSSALLEKSSITDSAQAAELVREFWEAVARNIPEWGMVQQRKIASSGVREDFIHSHGTIIHALGHVGATLLAEYPTGWKRPLGRIKTIDWARTNYRLWEGRATVGGRVQKSRNNVFLTINALKNHIGLSLTPEEQRLEDAFIGGKQSG